MKTLQLTNSQQLAIVDDEDYEKLKTYRWRLMKVGYVATGHGSMFQALAHFILTPKSGFEIDHIDRNKLNNQRTNLRYLTRSQNSFNSPKQRNNTSGYKGVSLKETGKWVAYITVNGKCSNLGTFDDPISAAKRYDEAVRFRVGECGFLNFPNELSK